MEISTTEKIQMYGHSTCPGVPSMKAMFKRASVDYKYIDIRQDRSAAELVREINNGYESVPTLIFPDGTTLTEPSSGAVKQKLQAMGYEVPFTAEVLANVPMIITIIIIIYAVLSFLEII